MAAPTGIVWGSIVGSYGRIGIYKSLSSTATTTTVKVQIWFWSKYSVSDSTNTLYYVNAASTLTEALQNVGAVNINTTVASGDGWSESNQVLLKSYQYSYTRGTTSVTRYLDAKLTDVDRVGGNMYASTYFTVPALDSYTVSYNANGGSGAPGSQTKWYGKALTLSTTKPTRTGYTFQGWATSASGAVINQPGGTYTGNAAVTYYAVWKANTYTVSYNANGGSGAPSSQTKTHDVTLKLSTTIPTRTNYTFKGWGTSASATTVAYAAGANYTGNTALTLYAIWEIAYIKPRIFNLTASRCDSAGNETDDGACGLVKFEWQSDYAAPTITIGWEAAAGAGSKTIAASGTSGAVSAVIGDNGLSTDAAYEITATVADSGGSSTAKTTLNGMNFPVDYKAGGKGVSFGKPAELGAEESLTGAGVAEFAFEGKFNTAVYGKALGMDRLPAIPENSDLDNYLETGCYAVQSNAIAATVANIPVDRAGRLEVWSATGEGVRLEQWSYLRQRFIPYNSGNAVWEREITRSSDNVWRYYDWWRSSLTPTAAEKVYSRAAIVISLNANFTLNEVNTYAKIPLNNLAVTTGDRLTLQDNSIRIGAGISYIKVSGQALINGGTAVGNRHVRIQKVSGGTTTSVAWTCVYGSNNTLYSLAPVIVPVKEGDLIRMVYYTGAATDVCASGSSANGYQTYLTVEEL